ncbi:MAG: hypothetical protein AAFQ89_21650, partial [Cyanobacteria bacterium J06626_18]
LTLSFSIPISISLFESPLFGEARTDRPEDSVETTPNNPASSGDSLGGGGPTTPIEPRIPASPTTPVEPITPVPPTIPIEPTTPLPIENPIPAERTRIRIPQYCNGVLAGSANFRDWPALTPSAIRGVIPVGQWVSLTGKKVPSDGLFWYEAVNEAVLTPSVEPAAQNQLQANQLGWIADCFVE